MELEIPNQLKVVTKSTGSILSISTVIGILISLFGYFKFNDLKLEYKIILFLSVFLIIAIVDIVILYVRDREKQYIISYLNTITANIKNDIAKVKLENKEIRNENNSILKEIKLLKNDIKLNSKK